MLKTIMRKIWPKKAAPVLAGLAANKSQTWLGLTQRPAS
jgi:hypothetical protein